MARLIFSDGKEKEVDYNTAAKILQVLRGEKEPEDDKQAKYIMYIKDVRFDNKGKPDKPWEAWLNKTKKG